jgi:hypothetical protein
MVPLDSQGGGVAGVYLYTVDLIGRGIVGEMKGGMHGPTGAGWEHCLAATRKIFLVW